MKTKNIKVSIPEYLTIRQWQEFSKYKDAGTLDRLIRIISIVTEIPYEEVRRWDTQSLVKVSNKINDLMFLDSQFHPIIEWNDQVLGFSALSKSKLGEYIDLDHYSKNVDENLHMIASILYRPIVKHSFDGWKWLTKSSYKLATNKIENPWQYYTLKDYNSTEVPSLGLQFKEFPVHIILGALGFIGGTLTLLANDIHYSQDPLTKTLMESTILTGLSANIGDGFLSSTDSPVQGSSL